jgi:16S rRNA processing protein RimM
VTATKTDKFITIGRFGAPYGVKGWMKIQSFTVPVENILDYEPWYIEQNGDWQAISLSGQRKHNQGVVATIEGCDDREQTVQYRNVDIAVPRNELPELEQNEYYWTDLEGLKVNTVTGKELGIIDHVFATGANDVLVVKGEKEHLVPYLLEQVVKKIDLDNNTMLIDWDTEF